MKTNNATLASLRRMIVLSLLILVMPLIALLAAEDPTANPAEIGNASKTYALEITGGRFSHKGKDTEANLRALVDALREMYPKVNIVLAPEVARTRILDLKLHFSQLEDTLEALRVASGYRFTWRRGNGPAGEVDPNTGLPAKSGGSRLYVLDMGFEPPPPRKRVVEVFNLSGYLQQQGKRDPKDVEDSLMKIEEIVGDTLRMLDQDESVNEARPAFRFHPGANLLIVTGTLESIDVARKVVNALPGATPGLITLKPGTAGSPEMSAEDAFRKRYGLPSAGNRTPEPQPSPAPQR